MPACGRHEGYLTRRDKVILAISLCVVIPVWYLLGPFSMFIALPCILIGLALALARGSRPEADTRDVPRRMRLTQWMNRPLKPRHHYAINQSEPRAADEDPEL